MTAHQNHRPFVSLSVVWIPGGGDWEAWDNRQRPRVIGCGSTPHEALFELIEKLHSLGIAAPEWVREDYNARR